MKRFALGRPQQVSTPLSFAVANINVNSRAGSFYEAVVSGSGLRVHEWLFIGLEILCEGHKLRTQHPGDRVTLACSCRWGHRVQNDLALWAESSFHPRPSTLQNIGRLTVQSLWSMRSAQPDGITNARLRQPKEQFMSGKESS